MGHQRIATLPRTTAWDEVVELIASNADANQVAQGAITATEAGLRSIAKDDGVVHTVLLLMQLPHAARQPDYLDQLNRLGLCLRSDPAIMDLAAGFSRAIDRRLARNKGRTDLGEMAEMAAIEALTEVLHARTASFFDTTPAMVRGELASLHTVKQFGTLGRTFFGKFLFKALDYFLSRATPLQLGEGERFLGLAAVGDFDEALRLHCWETSALVRTFCGRWKSKTTYEQGNLEVEHVRKFVHGAMKKLVSALKNGGRTRAQ